MLSPITNYSGTELNLTSLALWNAQGTLTLHPDMIVDFDKGGKMRVNQRDSQVFTNLKSGTFKHAGKSWTVTRTCTETRLKLALGSDEIFFWELAPGVTDTGEEIESPRKCYKIVQR